LTQAEWEAEFARYQGNPHSDHEPVDGVDDFKFIYWWNGVHRQLGRVIGLVWGLGFWASALGAQDSLQAGTPRLLFIGALGGVQGFSA